MAITSSVPNNNKLYGVISSITTDTLMGEVSYSPISWGATGKYFEAVIPADAAAQFAPGDTVTVLIKATAVSITNYDLP